MFDFALSAFVTLFVIIDPLSNMPIFVGLTKGADNKQRIIWAIRATLVAMFVLVLFSLFGSKLLGFLGIGLPAFRIAGGIMLGFIALEMVFEKRNPRKSKTAGELNKEIQPDDPSVFPVAIPLLAGPGAIATVMLLASEPVEGHSAEPIVLAALAAVMSLNLLVFMMAGATERLLGDNLTNVMTRLLGILLAAMSVQFIIDGIKGAFGL